MKKLKIGNPAPLFKGINEHNESVSLKDYQGRKLVLYFYPKDNTPTCTIESCNLRDNYRRFKKAGYEILGVSADSVKKHQNFIRKFDLPFSLIADTSTEICKMYGVWGRKKLFGVEYDGIIRTTFVIDENGIITDIIEDVKSADHSMQILA